MQTGDIPRVKEIADSLDHAPHWPIEAYQAALNPLSEPRRITLVAETVEPGAPISGAVVGFVVASLVAGEAELESIAVAPEGQRQGTATELLSQLFAHLKGLAVARVHLEVRSSNRPASGLYGRHGFRREGRRAGYYADPVEDAELLSLDLI